MYDNKKIINSVLFVLIAALLFFLFYKLAYKRDILFLLKENYKNEIEFDYKGIIEEKYVDKQNHNSPFVKFTNGEAMAISGVFWSKMQEGDSISKIKGDSIIQIFRQGKKIELDIRPFYESLIEREKNKKQQFAKTKDGIAYLSDYAKKGDVVAWHTDTGWLFGGAFDGSVKNSDGTVTASQTVNPNQAEVLEDISKSSKGVIAMHETLEAYVGAKKSPGASPAKTKPTKQYLKAHNKANSIDSRVKNAQNVRSRIDKSSQNGTTTWKAIIWFGTDYRELFKESVKQ